MPILREELRQDIKEKPCEKCGEPIDEKEDSILSFYHGSFIQLHEECAAFMQHAQKGPREAPYAERKRRKSIYERSAEDRRNTR